MLTELLVAVLIFMLFSTAMLATISMALQAYRDTDRQDRLQQAVQSVFNALSLELRQAIPDSDPGGTNPPTGYLSIVPLVAPTGVLAPNANQPNNSSIIFTEPNPNNYNPSLAGWNSASPINYQKVRYYIQGSQMLREIITYNANGSVATTQTDIVAELTSGGNLAISCVYQSPTLFTVTVNGNLGSDNYSLNSNIYLASE